jgi:hypothetical protein
VAERFEIGDEVDIRFDKSIVTGVRRWKGGCAITVQTADAQFTFDVGAADTAVSKTGVRHDLQRCPICHHGPDHCWHATRLGVPDSAPNAGGSRED